MEDSRHVLSGGQLVRHLVDVVSRGGNLLLNVGPTAPGSIPEVQRTPLEALARWMVAGSAAVHGSRQVDVDIARPSNDPWVRWTSGGGFAWAFIGPTGRVEVDLNRDRVDVVSAVTAPGVPVSCQHDGPATVVEVPARSDDLPAVVRFNLR